MKAHGLDGGLVEPDWQPLTLAELRELLAKFSAARRAVAIRLPVRGRFLRQPWCARCNGTVFVKRHARSIRDREGLLEEHRFLAHLLAHGASVPRVLLELPAKPQSKAAIGPTRSTRPAAGIDLYGDAISWTPFLCVCPRALGRRSAGAPASGRGGIHRAARESRDRWWRASRSSPRRSGAAMAAYLAARPSLAHHHLACAAARNRRLNLLAPFHWRAYCPCCPLLPRFGRTTIFTRPICCGAMQRQAAQATAVIDSGSLTGPMRFTIWPMPSSATSWSG